MFFFEMVVIGFFKLALVKLYKLKKIFIFGNIFFFIFLSLKPVLVAFPLSIKLILKDFFLFINNFVYF